MYSPSSSRKTSSSESSPLTSSMVPERISLPPLDDGYLVAELFRHLQHVGGEEDGAACGRRAPASCP